MSELPVFYDHRNIAASSVSPSTVHCKNTQLSRYFQRYLLQKAFSVYKWTIPAEWSENYIKYVLYCRGFFGVVETDKFGVIPVMCGLYGYDVQYQPTNIIVTNPLIKGILRPRIGKECEIVRLSPDYGGIMDKVNFYAEMMALSAESAGMNLLNSKLAYIFAAENKAAAESFKKLFDRVASGEPAAVIDKNLYSEDGKPAWQTFSQNLQQNYIAGQVLSDMRKWEEEFCTDIGLPNANTDKRERLIVDEVNANNIETESLASLWLEELRRCCSKVRNMFDVDLDVDWRFKQKEVAEDETGNDVGFGAV